MRPCKHSIRKKNVAGYVIPIYVGWRQDLILSFLSLQVEVSAITGPGEVNGHLVGHEGRPIYQGLVREGIIKMSSCWFERSLRYTSVHLLLKAFEWFHLCENTDEIWLNGRISLQGALSSTICERAIDKLFSTCIIVCFLVTSPLCLMPLHIVYLFECAEHTLF